MHSTHVALRQRREVFQIETAVLPGGSTIARLIVAAGKIVARVQTEATKEEGDCDRIFGSPATDLGRFPRIRSLSEGCRDEDACAASFV